MSSFFADEDNITLGVQGSNIAEVAQFSSTTDHVFLRLYTNNGSETENYITGSVIGSSNYDKTTRARNNMYLGHISGTSNISRVLTIEDQRVGINTDTPQALLHVSGLQGSNSLQILSASDPTRILVVDSKGNLGIGTTSPGFSISVFTNDSILIPRGGTSTRPSTPLHGCIRYNTDTNQFEGFGAGNAWGTLGGVASTDMSTYLEATNTGFLRFVNCNLETMRTTSAGNVGIGTITPQARLHVDGSLLASSIDTASISSSQSSFINMNQSTLSNASSIAATEVTMDRIATINAQNVIDVQNNSFSNVGGIETRDLSVASITGTGANQSVSFEYSRLLDIDSLVVRSNITVAIPGLNTFTNLPLDLVRVDAATGKILDQYISNNILRLMENGLINPALLPPVETDRRTLMHSKDRVGIGIRNPQQKLHVHGTAVVTSGRLGIGTTSPIAAFQIDDQNSSLVTMKVAARGSTDVLDISGQNGFPLLYINAACNVGIHTTSPFYDLHVEGTIYGSKNIRTNALISDTGTIDCSYVAFSNVLSLQTQNLHVTNSITLPTVQTANTVSQTTTTNTITANTNISVNVTSPLHVSGFSSSLYETHDQVFGTSSDLSRIGMKVDHSILAKTVLTISDRRMKTEIKESDMAEDLASVLSIPVRTFTFIDNQGVPPTPTIGFIAQEVEQIVPSAVQTIRGPVPSIMAFANRISASSVRITQTNVSHNIKDGTMLKLIMNDADIIVRVQTTEVADSYTDITFETELPEGETIYVYGEVVDDFKLLETYTLLPFVLNAVKQLHKEIVQQKECLEDVLTRIATLEARLS